jgi:hypothetical protein
MLLATGILLLLAGMLLQSLLGLRQATTSGGTAARMQDGGQRALQRVVDDLRVSGIVSQVGLPDYPYLFEPGFADPLFAVHDHVQANQQADADDYDFGATREIVFRLPADADVDGVPDVDAGGSLVWDVREFSFVVVTNADGVNELQRRIDGLQPEVIARYVERVVFSTRQFSPTVPLGSVRVEIFFRQPDENGLVHRYSIETVVRMRNSESLVG